MKKWEKYNRKFLNVPKSNCLGAVSWNVGITDNKIWCAKTHKHLDKREWTWGGTIIINREASDLYVSRKAHMRALYNMRTELNTFIEACEQAIKDVEEANAEKQESA